MNIAFITSEYPHKKLKLNVGGIGSFLSNFAEQLVSRGHQVTVFLYSQTVEEILLDKGVEIHLIKQKKVRAFTWWFNRKYIENYINKVVLSKGIEVLEAPDWTGITAFMKFKCPLIIRLHGSDTYFCHLEKRKQKKKNYFFEKKAIFGANHVVGVSNFVASKTKELFCYKKRISVIYNTIDSNIFKPNVSIKIKEKTILYFGTLIRKKGVLELASIFNKIIEKIPSAKLILLGKDVIDIKENKSTLTLFKDKLTNQSKENVVYFSEVSYNEVQNHISTSEVIVLPSFAEAFPMTWLEAMSMQKKLVTSNIGWSKELMIDGNTGFVENPKNHSEFADKILYLLENKEEGEELAKNARQRIINKFDIKKSIEENIKLYMSIQ
ncbi:glycosyl transferase [Polaribacter sp. SA4-10]|uniref:glycosyltransferase family 4 protein n=1 Tax=Polaribacter sp. SA4-10 TaxID=754397 RepID=UPI000B3C252C|nr:glycosyltransferase family 4 protein [Polaribacter sp. SA4-10]ARV05509.1 glycosyl transferase [Polaribacter sp. SA4-10]